VQLLPLERATHLADALVSTRVGGVGGRPAPTPDLPAPRFSRDAQFPSNLPKLALQDLEMRGEGANETRREKEFRSLLNCGERGSLRHGHGSLLICT